MDFPEWQKHVNQVVADTGEWIGLANADGVPVCDFPAAESVEAPRTRLAVADHQVVIPARGRIAPTNGIVERLLAPNIGVFDESGYLAPATGGNYLVVIARPGIRLAFDAVFATGEGPSDAPERLTVGGVSLTDLLDAHPCPSIPHTWEGGEFTEWREDAGGPYRKPRQLAPVELATRADGYTVTGPAVRVIRDLCQDSFDAVNALKGWADPHLVVDYGVVSASGERITIQVQDDPLWSTILAPAESAGVNVWVELWWPGDPPITVRGPRLAPDKATGERFGSPVRKSFDHPVGRVCVQEVGRS